MAAKQYVIRAVWDPEARVFFAESNVPGLNVEAETIPELVEILQDVVPALLLDANAPQSERRRVRLEADLALA
jgi:Domain of unknown function (DUF1902)